MIVIPSIYFGALSIRGFELEISPILILRKDQCAVYLPYLFDEGL